MTQPLDFQNIILALQHFWAEQGCLIWQPYYSQIGAGTMNPATFLRVLGPEPWNVAYVEPSIRPDDARYGENPNRMQQHYQFQVILKPDPGNPQEIYLKSLEAIGIDPRQHDIRFVEDNWEQPALGAWGLGWEVWLDGQEITQFTYFQQAGGQVLDPVSVELTYGLDRIAIALQRVHGFTEIRWNEHFTAGDVNLQAEQEHSKYYFEVADVDRLRQIYALNEAEANACAEQRLILPAFDYLLKCSHTFNVLDARGAVGVTERQAMFGRMREIARRVSELYLELRQHLEYPWLDESTGEAGGREAAAKRQVGEARKTREVQAVLQPAPFLFEIGSEELPAKDLDDALAQLSTRVPALLDQLRLEHGEIRVHGTPRRQVVYVENLSPRQPDIEQLVKGPPADRAFNAEGQPTKAAEGFARSKGLAVTDLEVRELDGGRYVAAVIQQAGRAAVEVLSEAIPGLIASLRFDKTMRWNSSNIAYSRPIRWLLALYGEEVVPFEYAGLRSGRATRGLRFNTPYEIQVENAADFFQALSTQGILLPVSERQDIIRQQVESIAHEVGGAIGEDPALLAEVANLVEAPTALLGTFDPDHLKLPRQVLISVMKKHQRYFPVLDARKGDQAALLPYFIAVRNGDGQGLDLVTEGNEHVIRARFADAAFFVREDLKQPLKAYLPKLGTLTFQVKLGSMLDKTRRIQAVVSELAPRLSLDDGQLATARRAAELCKADLATHMVVEMTSLQGTMGRYYALQSGESEAVANTIFEHYLPRFSGDSLPKTLPGLAVGVADRLDTLVGLFAAGLAPTGARDPFAQRRAALGLVQALIAHDIDFDVRQAMGAAAGQLPIPASDETLAACLDFVIERLRNLLIEQGRRYDIVDAVLSTQGYDPARAARAAGQLSTWVARPDWHTILPAYARCVRITRDQKTLYPVSPDLFAHPAERALYDALLEVEKQERTPGSVDDFLNTFLPLIPAINSFFDHVMVMVDEAEVRQNRLGLLQRIAGLANGAADMTRLEGF